MASMFYVVVVFWILSTRVEVTRAQLSDAYSNNPLNEDVELGTSQATVAQVVPGRPSQHFQLVQTLQAPTLTNPSRLPECIATLTISKLLTANINEEYSAYMTGPAVVETSTFQQGDICTYRSYVSYNGTSELAKLLAQAANTGKFCSSMGKYCFQLLDPRPGYRLLSTSGTERAPLPPVLDFHCVKSTFSQRLDHFSNTDLRVFSQVYWVCDSAWPRSYRQQVKKGNIIVFLGNESPLGVPKQPIVFENARRMNALVLLVEHRYYGESIPFPVPDDGILPTDEYKWLTIEQVIEDTSTVLSYVRQQYRVPRSTKAVVIGGSYGGMISSYHRVVKPRVFAAAISASAPNNYIFNTYNWERTANKYHERIAASLLVNSGSAACGETVRQAMDTMEDMYKSPQGRRQLATMFSVCDGNKYLRTESDGFNFYMNTYDFIAGAVQVNNQPSLLGKVSSMCNIIQDMVTRQGKTPLEGLAAANIYFQAQYNKNATNNYCIYFTPTYNLISSGLPSFSYQCCTQGTVYSSALPSQGTPGDLIGAYDVTEADLRQECEAMFGKSVPHLKPPSFAINIKPLIRRYGGVVFTNGDVDGWAGGSYFSYKDLFESAGPQSEAENSSVGPAVNSLAAASDDTSSKGEGPHEAVAQGGAGKGPHEPLVAFVVYRGASHCTDTHTYNWDNPIEPVAWKMQRAQAMDYAIRFMRH